MRVTRRSLVAVGVAAALAWTAPAAGAKEVGDVGALAGPCGSSYNHVGHHPIRGGGEIVGYFDIYWSTSTKRNCLVVNGSGPAYDYRAMKYAAIKFSDQPEYMWGAEGTIDYDFYRFYAGPVYTMAGLNGTGRCVDVIARIDYPGGRAAPRLNNLHCG